MSTIAVLLSLFFRQVKEDKFKRLTGRPNQPSGKAGCGTKGDGSKERRSLWVDGVVDRFKKKNTTDDDSCQIPPKKGESLLLPLFLFHSLLIRFSLLQLSTLFRLDCCALRRASVGRGPRVKRACATHLIITSCSFSADSFSSESKRRGIKGSMCWPSSFTWPLSH